MQNPLSYLALICGIAMCVEGVLIAILRRSITPLPSKVLYLLGRGLAGKQNSAAWFAGKATPESIRVYAFFALFFGAALILASFISLRWG